MVSHAGSKTRADDESATDNTEGTAVPNSNYLQPQRQDPPYYPLSSTPYATGPNTWQRHQQQQQLLLLQQQQQLALYAGSGYPQTAAAAPATTATNPYGPYFNQGTAAPISSGYANSLLQAASGPYSHVSGQQVHLDPGGHTTSRSPSSEDTESVAMYVNHISHSFGYWWPHIFGFSVPLTRSAKNDLPILIHIVLIHLSGLPNAEVKRAISATKLSMAALVAFRSSAKLTSYAMLDVSITRKLQSFTTAMRLAVTETGLERTVDLRERIIL